MFIPDSRVLVYDSRGQIENHANHFGAESTKKITWAKTLITIIIDYLR